MDASTVTLGEELTLARPVWTVAPMVTACDLPFRLLTRRHGARLVYSEMLMADQFAMDFAYRVAGLGLTDDHEVPAGDHPLIVQFAANDPATLLQAGLAAQRCGADAIDLNLGCPQKRARDGHYGSFLTDPPDWYLCCSLVRTCAESKELRIPVTCKIRLQPTVEATVEFARMLEAAGCAMIAVHGRQRGTENRKRSGPADLDAVRAVKAALRIPVLTNGNVSSFADALEALRVTSADGVMSAEEILRDPALFARCELTVRSLSSAADPHSLNTNSEISQAMLQVPDAVLLSDEYLTMCTLHQPSSVWQVEQGPCEVARQHLTKMLQHLLGTREFLKQPRYLAATSIHALRESFQKHFSSRLNGHEYQLASQLEPCRVRFEEGKLGRRGPGLDGTPGERAAFDAAVQPWLPVDHL